MSIPVHRIQKPRGPVLPQHIVRAMALCHLIEFTEGSPCPFAIILFGNTYQGTTVPNTPAHREQFSAALKAVRKMIKASDARQQEPLAPVTGNACSRCNFGKPHRPNPDKPTMRYGLPVEPYLLVGAKKVLHCICGDRFRQKPNHDDNRRLQPLE